MLQMMGSQTVGHDLMAKNNIYLNIFCYTLTGKDVHHLLFSRKNTLYVNILVFGNKLKEAKEKSFPQKIHQAVNKAI